MSSGHGHSRRQAYGRRMKDLRTRRDPEVPVDLDGPSEWSRGASWDDDQALHRPALDVEQGTRSARPT